MPGSSQDNVQLNFLCEGWSPTVATSEDQDPQFLQEQEDPEEEEGMVPETEDHLLENLLGACRIFTEMLVEEEEGVAMEEDDSNAYFETMQGGPVEASSAQG